MSVSVKQLTVGPVEENCYLVYSGEAETEDCVLVDPGAGGEKIIKAMKALQKKPAAVFLTHGHFDHIMGVEWIREQYPGIPVYACELEKEVIEDPHKSMLDMFPGEYALKKVEYCGDHTLIEAAGIRVELLSTPGHTSGSSCWYLRQEGILFSGDTLFRESVGRTDFPTGNSRELRSSILEKLKVLPEDTVVYPGHGDRTDIAHEKKYNFVMLGLG